MTESRPVPGPPRPGPGPSPAADAGQGPEAARSDPFADLDERPVSEHVAVYEAEHARLERELGTIDQL
jgi:hypothetical protein